jgi:hypothetical protein
MSRLTDLKDQLVNGLAAAALLGGGAAVIDNRVDVARHDERLTRIESLDESMEKLTGEMGRTREQLARLEARQAPTQP